MSNIPQIVIFNAANNALRSARYFARNETYAQAAHEVAIARAFVRVLQTVSPPLPVEVKSESMKGVPMDSYSGVGIMFKYQMLRWSVKDSDLDDGLYTED